MNGLRKVKELLALKTQAHYKAGYRLDRISFKTASNIINEKYRNMDEAIMGDTSNDFEKVVTVLYTRTKHPISQKDIVIIDCFFIDDYEN